MYVIRKKIIYGLEKNAINIINTWKDISRKLIKRYVYIQYEFLIDCKVRKFIPISMKINKKVYKIDKNNGKRSFKKRNLG